ncbi:MAG: glycosyltransferase [candidate division KSB1 bacterium]|nr:glycosyltransferase [candidate division KSB1 bacterium]
MRILMTNWVYLPEFSGAALQCHRLSRALQRQGVQINVLTGTHERGMAGPDRIDDIPVHRVLRDVSSPIGQIRYFRAMQSFIRQHWRLFDIVHTHGFHPRVNMLVSKI